MVVLKSLPGVKGFFASVISESAPNLSAAAGHLSSNGGLGGAWEAPPGIKGFFASVISESAPNLSAAAGHPHWNEGLGGAAGRKQLLRVRNFRIRAESFRGRRNMIDA